MAVLLDETFLHLNEMQSSWLQSSWKAPPPFSIKGKSIFQAKTGRNVKWKSLARSMRVCALTKYAIKTPFPSEKLLIMRHFPFFLLQEKSKSKAKICEGKIRSWSCWVCWWCKKLQRVDFPPEKSRTKIFNFPLHKPEFSLFAEFKFPF